MPIRLQLKNGTHFDFNPKNPFPPHRRVRHTLPSDGIRRRSGQGGKTARLRQPQLQSRRIHANRQRLVVRRQVSRAQNFRRRPLRYERLYRRPQNPAHPQPCARNQHQKRQKRHRPRQRPRPLPRQPHHRRIQSRRAKIGFVSQGTAHVKIEQIVPGQSAPVAENKDIFIDLKSFGTEHEAQAYLNQAAQNFAASSSSPNLSVEKRRYEYVVKMGPFASQERAAEAEAQARGMVRAVLTSG